MSRRPEDPSTADVTAIEVLIDDSRRLVIIRQGENVIMFGPEDAGEVEKQVKGASAELRKGRKRDDDTSKNASARTKETS